MNQKEKKHLFSVVFFFFNVPDQSNFMLAPIDFGTMKELKVKISILSQLFVFLSG